MSKKWSKYKYMSKKGSKKAKMLKHKDNIYKI